VNQEQPPSDGARTNPADGHAQAVPQAAAVPAPMAKQQRMMDEARDAWLVLQAAAEGYRQNVRSLERKQGLYDLLSVLVAIWLVVVLWGVKELIPHGEYQVWITTVINVAGTGAAIGVVSLVIMSWRQEWRGRTDRQRQLADTADRLGARYFDIFQEEVIDEGRFNKAKQDHRAFISDENLPLGGIPPWARHKGFQHVGQRHPKQNIRCNTCNRDWNELRKRRGAWWRRWWFGKCDNCGVPK
jgi:hypothetical protein